MLRYSLTTLVLLAAPTLAVAQEPMPQESPPPAAQPPQEAQPATPAVPAGYESAPPPAQAPAAGYAQPGYPPAAGYPQPQPQAPPPPVEEDLHDVSLTFSPVHLLFPIFELTAEFRLADAVGLAAIAGGGSVTVEDGLGDSTTFSAFELGAHFRWYPVGDFDHGMQLGAELLYIFVSGSVGSSVTGSGSGLAVGPFIGYKITTSVGFTFDAQLGVQVAGIAARATDGTTTEESSETHVIPLLNLNIGWAF